MSNGRLMSLLGMRLIIFLLILAPLLTRAGGDEVVIVYNKRMPGSEAVADYYAKMRQVPQRQIYGFSLTTDETMSRDEFRDALQLSLARRLESDGLWQFGSVTNAGTNGEPPRVERRVVASKIRYLVLCYGVPLKIAPDPDLKEPFPKNARAELDRNEAAVDSELAWLPLVERDFPLAGPLPNWAYGATNTALLNPTNGILLVARLDGPNAKIAKGLVDKALEAERDGLWGRAYFDMRGLGKTDSYYLGDEWIAEGAEICRELGFETTVDDKPETFSTDFPMSQIAIYCGWYDVDVSGPFALPRVEFMPGAFAYHLHSFSAATLRSETQNWCGPLLAKGATCTMGCVYEPYLTGTPNVAAFLARWLADRFHLWRGGLGRATGFILANHGHRRSALPAVRQTAAAHSHGTGASPQSAGRMVAVARRQSGSRSWRARLRQRQIIWKTSMPRPTAPCSRKNSPTCMKGRQAFLGHRHVRTGLEARAVTGAAHSHPPDARRKIGTTGPGPGSL